MHTKECQDPKMIGDLYEALSELLLCKQSELKEARKELIVLTQKYGPMTVLWTVGVIRNDLFAAKEQVVKNVLRKKGPLQLVVKAEEAREKRKR